MFAKSASTALPIEKHAIGIEYPQSSRWHARPATTAWITAKWWLGDWTMAIIGLAGRITRSAFFVHW
jgi:hypothetical protein